MLGEESSDYDSPLTVEEPELNDPRKPQLDTEDLDLYPVYLRVVDAGSVSPWCLERARVTVQAANGNTYHFDNPRLEKKKENARIWLGGAYGQRVFLRRVGGEGDTDTSS
ncbi:hypothetical protein OHS59_07715 [Streptomyces sp. NBC_00414]|uniref:hypothetical protein n=1 Tax=Streptomyces sp. NBC_00414 TaxID=2975739 RepID=UPI002E2462F3